MILGSLVLAAATAAAPALPVRPAKVDICAVCHGETGYAVVPVAPNLAGQRADYMQRALRKFRSGQRDGDGMNAVARTLSDADIIELSTWFAAQGCQEGAR